MCCRRIQGHNDLSGTSANTREKLQHRKHSPVEDQDSVGARRRNKGPANKAYGSAVFPRQLLRQSRWRAVIEFRLIDLTYGLLEGCATPLSLRRVSQKVVVGASQGLGGANMKCPASSAWQKINLRKKIVPCSLDSSANGTTIHLKIYTSWPRFPAFSLRLFLPRRFPGHSKTYHSLEVV